VEQPLKPLHSENALITAKLLVMEKLTTETITRSLKPGNQHSLKTRPDGTILDGHHRVEVLRRRGIAVDSLPREIIVRDDNYVENITTI
jgi:hypothetical protein